MNDKVLLIEDDLDFSDAVKNILKAENITIFHVETGIEALNLLNRDKAINLVIMDLLLPDYEGKLLAEEIRIKYKNVKVIVLTGHPEELTYENAKKIGIYNYLEKPIGKEQLKFAIKNSLSKTSLSQKMYISEIKIINIKCFEEFYINLEKKSEPILWTTILGDNATGKTTLLRSIALGLCDQASSAALIKELAGDLLRWDTLKTKDGYRGEIQITLKKEAENNKYIITTEIIKKTKYSPEEVYQRTKPEKFFPWDDIFICGYGANRATPADTSFGKYISLEAVLALFNNLPSFQNPELILRRQEPELQELIGNKLLKILMLDKCNKSIELTKRGMEIPGPWGMSPVGSLSDGYKSTIQWVLDFFSWQIFAENVNGSIEPTGILLIDELEQHLHPRWQRHIVGILKEQLPKVQFITTTHSPLITSSVGQLINENIQDKIIHLDFRKSSSFITVDNISNWNSLLLIIKGDTKSFANKLLTSKLNKTEQLAKVKTIDINQLTDELKEDIVAVFNAIKDNLTFYKDEVAGKDIKFSSEVQKELSDLKKIFDESGGLKKEEYGLSDSQKEDIKWFNIAILKNIFPQCLSKSLRGEKTICYQELDSLKGLRIDQVLASKAFDYQIDADPEVERVLSMASELASKGNNRTEDEETQYKKTKKMLTKILQPSGQTLIEREVQKDFYQEMKKQIKTLEAELFGNDK